MTDVPACAHTKIRVNKDNIAHCRDCTSIWLSASIVSERLAEEEEKVVSMASAMLWDFHERAVAKYGAQVGNVLHPDDDPSLMFEKTEEDCEDHEYENGECVKCGGSMFLGERE